MSDDAAVLDAVRSSPRPIEVTGDGPGAERLRAALGISEAPPDAPDAPGTIVETTGSVEEIRAALSRVAVLGTVVLAGPCPETGALDLHDDLHVRGITVVGVAPLSP